MRGSPLVFLFGTAIGLAAFLLFSVQPMIAKMVLPILGGTPGVWNTCMVFFQSMLLAAYAYAHWGSHRLGSRGQALVHVLLLVSLVGFLPLATPSDPPSSHDPALPAFWLFGMLLSRVGLPVFVVAATAPLLQRWFSLASHAESHDPYFLYAASNAGSLMGLLAYPLLIEPTWPLGRQRELWACGVLFLGVLIAACAWVVRGRREPTDAVEIGGETASRPAPGSRDRARWVLLAFIPSSWLLGVTTYITTDLASIPLLWTIPLALYLLTYILAFSRSSWRRTRTAGAFLPLVVVPLVLVMCAGFPQLFLLPLHLLAFLLGGLVCHGQLAASRPDARSVTAFYLAIALGGVLGGVFNALVAPLVFDRLAEYPLAIVLGCLVGPGVGRPVEKDGRWLRPADVLLPAMVAGLMAFLIVVPGEVSGSAIGVLALMMATGLGLLACVTGLRYPIRFGLTVAGVFLAASLADDPGGRLLFRDRDFFGTLRVLEDSGANVHRLLQGSTLHGQQSLEPTLRDEPSTYFTRSGPIGQLFTAIGPEVLAKDQAQIAIVGLGAGSLACYARPGQRWSFYEIDPAVVRIAENPRLFTFLQDARSRGVFPDIVLGDARLRIREAPDGSYHLLVLDAFSSDAVPVHLLSREAIRLYRSKLAEGGVLAFNLSNRYLDLEPVIGQQASDAGLACRIGEDVHLTAEEKQAGKQASIWAVMAALETDLGSLATDPRWHRPRLRAGARVWTDDFSDLASALVLGGRRFRDPEKTLTDEHPKR
jgi:hypothetical protein